MADDARMKRYEQNEINDEVFKLHRENPVMVEGDTFGIDNSGYMTNDGWAKFLRDLKSGGFRLARIGE